MTRHLPLLLLVGLVWAPVAWAQYPGMPAAPRLSANPGAPASADEPVTFTADSVSYDREHDIVTAMGHVQAWQNDHTLQADTVRFDRTTNVAEAFGNVVIIQPDAQVMFADYAELSEGMRDAVMKGMSAQMAENGKLVANGARRIAGSDGGEISELSRVIYSTCNLCQMDPTRPPLWQIRAASAVEDSEHQRMEFSDAFLDVFGIPVGYSPYFYSVDPSVSRGSGLLPPFIGTASHVGAFWQQPYYAVLDDQSDMTIAPTLTSKLGTQVGLEYRRMFNDGQTTISGSIANDNGLAGHLFAKGQFNFDDSWRYGYDINVASSSTYLRDYRIPSATGAAMVSRLYTEAFGEGAYLRIDTLSFQGLTNQVIATALPLVAPHVIYSFYGEPDLLGGHWSVDANAYNIYREVGTRTQRAALIATYDLPLQDDLGGLWKFSVHGTAAGYNASGLNLAPNFSAIASDSLVRALPQGAVEWRMPWARGDADTGRQVIEPIVQMIAASPTGSSDNYRIPNEDSLDLQFTDQNLFAWNRWPGLDRQEGGVRVNAGLHGAWFFPAGGMIDTLVGGSYKMHRDDTFPVGSGLTDYMSDYVGRITLAPISYFDITARGRFDHTNGTIRYGEAIAGFGASNVRFGVGYVYTTTNPFNLYDAAPGAAQQTSIVSAVPRNEALVSMTAHIDAYRLSGYVRTDIQTGSLVAMGATASWENECLIVAFNAYKRYTSFNGDNGASAFLIQLTFKTVGQFGFHAF